MVLGTYGTIQLRYRKSIEQVVAMLARLQKEDAAIYMEYMYYNIVSLFIKPNMMVGTLSICITSTDWTKTNVYTTISIELA